MIQFNKSDTVSAPSGAVLIVDDEQDLLQIMEVILSEAGMVCLCATKASTALDILKEHSEINVVVSDLRMPGMDGLQFLERVRQEIIGRSWLQFLFVTGHGTMDSAVKAMKLQAADFIHKPIRRVELLDAVKAALDRSVAQRTAVEIRQQGEVALSRLSGDIARISEALGIANSIPDTRMPEAGPDPIPTVSENIEGVDEEGRSNERILEFVKVMNGRNKLFKEELFVEPVWQMLFFLMECSLSDEDAYLTDLYNASGVSPATSARRVADLKEAGFVIISSDDFDKRRQKVSLSDEAFGRLKQYIRSIINTSSKQIKY